MDDNFDHIYWCKMHKRKIENRGLYTNNKGKKVETPCMSCEMLMTCPAVMVEEGSKPDPWFSQLDGDGPTFSYWCPHHKKPIPEEFLMYCTGLCEEAVSCIEAVAQAEGG
jgi:hypothetical protein